MASWHDPVQPLNEHSHTRKIRSARACDQCRQAKGKCENSQPGPCRTCALSGTECTFLGPSFKRGPPTGYIHAVEQRWHQVESLLGAIMACPDPRTQAIISELRNDDLAHAVLCRVDAGPFGPSGRHKQPEGATSGDLFASVIRADGDSSAKDSTHSRRLSRISREIVSSSQDDSLSTVPTFAWQDNLSHRLASLQPKPLNDDPVQPSIPTTPDISRSHLAQRRRLNTDLACCGDTQSDRGGVNDMSTLSDTEGYDSDSDSAVWVGQLSLDEHQEVRFHGKASGMHLLGRSDRTDLRHDGGIWHMPMARIWPPAEHQALYLLQEDDLHVDLPPIDVQNHLLDLYFTYLHPVIPVVHKARFMAEYNANKSRFSRNSSPDADLGTSKLHPKPEPSQHVSKLLLLSMFAIAARYAESVFPPPPKGKMWEAGYNYLVAAREILNKVFHRSQASTCQALLLLGHREFGIGSMQQGWIYLGMAIRMALDLGLNRNADKWQVDGADLFTSEEKQIRKQIWWCICIADKYGSVYMGRPISLRGGDYDTPLPDVCEGEEEEVWEPLSSDPVKIYYPPLPGRIMSCFRALSTLSVIMGSIMDAVYSVCHADRFSLRDNLTTLETRLDRWYIELPEGLRYERTSERAVPPPHVLVLHIRYWGSVLLLHRAFIPNWKRSKPALSSPSRDPDARSSRAFDLCQTAADHMSTIATTYLDIFGLKHACPLLSCFLLSAGIMYIVTLTLLPSDFQASLGLHRCLVALKEMEMAWPSARRAYELLHGVKIQFDNAWTQQGSGHDRQKRHAEDIFEEEKLVHHPQAFGDLPDIDIDLLPLDGNGVQDISTRMMAHMLGLDAPGLGPSASYFPTYEWWSGGYSPNPEQLQMLR